MSDGSSPGLLPIPARGREGPWAGPQPDSWVVDIGDGIGALIIVVPPELDEVEIELVPVEPDRPLTHTVVHERRVSQGNVFAALFPDLIAGEYTIPDWTAWWPGTVRVTGAAVVEIDWRSAGPDHQASDGTSACSTSIISAPAADPLPSHLRAEYSGVSI